jgi:hypothetical protein
LPLAIQADGHRFTVHDSEAGCSLPITTHLENIMKTLAYSLIASALALAGTLNLNAQQRANSTGGASPHETTSGTIGGRNNRVTITYGRPYSKAPRGGDVRKIWGGLVPWGAPWRLGSDEATTLITSVPIAFGETTIPAGAYTVYMVPMESGASKLAFSKKLGGWGIPVDVNQDVARVDLTKADADKDYDQLTISVPNSQSADGGAIKIMWEKTQFTASFKVKQ